MIKENTIIITVPNTLAETIKIQPDRSKIILVGPNESYDLKNIKFETTVAYNIKKLVNVDREDETFMFLVKEASKVFSIPEAAVALSVNN